MPPIHPAGRSGALVGEAPRLGSPVGPRRLAGELAAGERRDSLALEHRAPAQPQPVESDTGVNRVGKRLPVTGEHVGELNRRDGLAGPLQRVQGGHREVSRHHESIDIEVVHAGDVQARDVAADLRGPVGRGERQAAPETGAPKGPGVEVPGTLLLGVQLVAAPKAHRVSLGGLYPEPPYLALCHLAHEGGLGDDAGTEHIRRKPRVGLQEIAEIGRDHLHVAGGVVTFSRRDGRLGGAHERVIPIADGLREAARPAHRRQAAHLQIVRVPQPQ